MSKKKFSDADDALLKELGVEYEAKKAVKYTKEEERVIAGFEEIQRVVEENDKTPEHGEDKDIFERLYAVRLDRLKDLPQYYDLLHPLDHQSLLGAKKKPDETDLADSMDDDELLAALGVEHEVSPDEELKHVRTSGERRAAEEVAGRAKCKDFEQFKPLFEVVKADIESNQRQITPCKDVVDINVGDLFILEGQVAYVKNAGEMFVNDDGRDDCRLRIIFNNGTESNMLRRSFQKCLWKDESARRIVEASDIGPLFTGEADEEDQKSGVIYVLRSQSKDPYITEHRELIHKIGCTRGDVKRRIANASNDATYLLADVEVVATYELFNVNPNKLEKVFHKLFDPAKLNIEIKDRFGKPIKPREWFLVPLAAIQKAVECIKDGTITGYYYDTDTAMLERAE
jgi:hypothetical protein